MKLLYRIDPKERRLIRLHLEEYGAARKRILYLSTLKQLASSQDRDALALLIQERLRKTSGESRETISFSLIEFKDPQIVRLLVKTGSLFYDRKLLTRSCEGKLIWEGERISDTACRFEGFLQCGERKIPLKEALAVFPSFAVEGEELIFADLEEAREGSFVLEGRNLERFLKEQTVEFKEPTPRLILHGPSGSFAELPEKRWEKDLLEVGYLSKQVGRSSYYCPGDQVGEAISLLLAVGWEIFDDRGKRVVPFRSWKAEFSERGNQLTLSLSKETRAALSAVKAGRSLFDFDGGAGWVDRKEALKIFGGVLKDCSFEEESVALPKQRVLDCIPFLEEKNILVDPALREKAEKLFLQQEALPGERFKGTLLHYQQEGVNWLFNLYQLGLGGLLADEMGLGKTVQLLAFFSLLRTKLPILIVAPSSLLYQWHSEFRRFLPECSIHLYAGADRELKESPFILTSYALLRQDVEVLKQLEFEVVLFDESSNIKNRKSRTFEAAAQLQVKARFCINGTPIENCSEELVAQFSFLMPGLFKEAESPQVIQKKITPCFLRRKKSDVELELPEKVDQVVWVEMTEIQMTIYREFQRNALQRLKPKVAKEGAAKHRMEILEVILRLRQICCDPRLVGENERGAKLELLLNDLEELLAEGRKVLIYSQFTSMLDLIQKDAAEKGWKLFRLDGATQMKERGPLVQRFQEEEGAALFLLSLKAGGVGLNLTAAEAVFLFDPWWNEAVERQAIDRVHRIGQKKCVFIKRYLAPESIEEKMLGLKNEKLLQADQILEAEPSESCSAEEWFSLLDL